MHHQLGAQYQQRRQQYRALYNGLTSMGPCVLDLVVKAVNENDPRLSAWAVRYDEVQAKWEHRRSDLDQVKQMIKSLSDG
jgi:hypothetical protein